MIDSPMHPYGDTNFMVVEAGITDPTEKKAYKIRQGALRGTRTKNAKMRKSSRKTTNSLFSVYQSLTLVWHAQGQRIL